MCGLIGFSSKDENFDLQKIKMLIYINSIERGQDATGLFSPKNGLKKSIEKGWEFVINPVNNIQPDKILIAHVRSKTIGVNSIINAHPFERGNCILAHNGTLKNYTDLATKYKVTNYNVDSDVIAGCIENSQNLDVLKEIDGGAAFIIYDNSGNDDMYVFRNSERPLYRGKIGNSMYISSIEEPLYVIGCTQVKEFKENCLYNIKNGEIISSKNIKNKPYKEPTVYQPYIDTGENRFIGCLIRMKYEFTSRVNNVRVHFDKGEYCEVKEVIDNGKRFSLINNKSGLAVEVSRACIEVDDLIVSGDYVRAIIDVKFVNSDEIAIKENEVAKVSMSYEDSTVSLENIIPKAMGTNVISRYLHKRSFIKISREEGRKLVSIKNSTNTISYEELMSNTLFEASPFDISNFDNIPENALKPITPIIINNLPSFVRTKLHQLSDTELNTELTEYFKTVTLTVTNIYDALKHNADILPIEDMRLLRKLMLMTNRIHGKIYPYINLNQTLNAGE